MSWRDFPQHRGDALETSRERVSRHWRRAGYRYARRVGGLAGAVATAAVSNLLAPVPEIDTSPPMFSLGRRAGDELLPRHRAKKQRATDFRDKAGAAQISYGYDVTGRTLTTAQRIMKLMAASMTVRRDYFGWLSNMTASYRAYNCYAYRDTAQSRTTLPVYLADLTSVVQGTTGALGIERCPRVLYQMIFDHSSDQYDVIARSGLSPDLGMNNAPIGASTTYCGTWYAIQGKTTGITHSAMIDKLLVKDVDIGMVIQAPRNYHATVWVQLVQFTDENLVPKVLASDTNGARPAAGTVSTQGTAYFPIDTDNPDNSEMKKFWNQQTQFLIGNQLSQKSFDKRIPGMNVLYTKKFIFNPIDASHGTATTDGDPDGREVQFKLRYNMDKVCDYNIRQQVTGINEIAIEDANEINDFNTHDQLYPFINPKGRVYLLIRSTVPEVTTTAPTDVLVAKNAVSFDLRMVRTALKLRAENNM